MTLLSALSLWLLAINLIAFAAFARDKRSAMRGDWRIPEAHLLRFALLGGWPGAKIAQRMLRHKTRKMPFARQLNRIPAIQFLILCLGFSAWVAVGRVPPQEMIGRFAETTASSTMPRRFGPGSEGF